MLDHEIDHGGYAAQYRSNRNKYRREVLPTHYFLGVAYPNTPARTAQRIAR